MVDIDVSANEIGARIAPVPAGVARPFWSVMIPSYNSTELLADTLRCVLDQDPGPDQMQIAIVEDRSTSTKAEEIVQKAAGSRVEFYRQPSSVGLAANWNMCVSKSRGQWIHILHHDDLVLPGFYSRMRYAAETELTIGAAFCRHFFMDADGHWQFISELERKTAGTLDGWLEQIAVRQRIQCASVVVRRSVYEHLGGFRRDLPYALDWEMCVRIASHYPVWYEPQPLASYRLHDRSETWRLAARGADMADLRKAVGIFQQYLPRERQRELAREAIKCYANRSLGIAVDMLLAGQREQAMAQIREARKCDSSLRFCRRVMGLYRWSFKIWLRQLISGTT